MVTNDAHTASDANRVRDKINVLEQSARDRVSVQRMSTSELY